MTREEALDKLCHSYSGYFDVVRYEEPKGYLVAEAGLHIHSEKYVLVKAAKLWEQNTTNMSVTQCSRDFRSLWSSWASKGVTSHGQLALLAVPFLASSLPTASLDSLLV